jgi:hypothetical protein
MLLRTTNFRPGVSGHPGRLLRRLQMNRGGTTGRRRRQGLVQSAAREAITPFRIEATASGRQSTSTAWLKFTILPI